MPTLNQIRTRVDNYFTQIWPTIVARQENYRANRGVYWQGLKTHTIVPNHTDDLDGDSAPDLLRTKPSDVFGDWITVFPGWDGLPIPMAMQVDSYGGPRGEGWVARVWIRFNGVTYTRAQNVGPEIERTHGWRIENEEARA